jgi:Na+-driven multidrug efflux pump
MKFTRLLGVGNTLLIAVFALSPWGSALFQVLFDMPPILASLGAMGLLLSLPQPGLLASQSLHLGLLVGHGRTRDVTVSMAIYLVVAGICLQLSVQHATHQGLLYVAGCFSIATVAQVLFLAWRSLPLRRP